MAFNADMVPPNKEKPPTPKLKRVTHVSEFKRLDEESKNMKVKAKKKYIVQGIKRLFKNENAAEYYVDRKMYNKWRTLMERRKKFDFFFGVLLVCQSHNDFGIFTLFE